MVAAITISSILTISFWFKKYPYSFVQFHDILLKIFKMPVQYIVDVIENRHFIVADDPHNFLNPFVVFQPDGNTFPKTCLFL